QRLITTILKHPALKDLVASVIEENRHKVTTTKIQLPGAMLSVAGLNEGNASTLSWPLIWISEAWQHGSDGLLFKAFKRTDRYPRTFKILNESQASLVDTDLHAAVKDVRQVPLTWRCPKCDGEQTWEWRHWSFLRPGDFIPRAQKTITPATVNGSVIEVSES